MTDHTDKGSADTLVPAAKFDDLNSVPRIHMVEGQGHYYNLLYNMVHLYVHTHIHILNKHF